jgi:hypothetical protein
VFYAFGGGGSGAWMRPRAYTRYEDGTSWGTIGIAPADACVLSAMLPHEVIAVQHGTDADLQGFGCSSFPEGIWWREPLSCSTIASDAKAPPRE